MLSQDKIISLLGQGLSAEIVATAVGCDPSYISQLLSNEEIHQKVSELRVQNLQSATQRDNRADAIEDKILIALENKIDSQADFMKINDLLRAYTVVNAAKRRGAQVQDTMIVNNTIVNLTLPEKIMRAFTLNATNQVVEVDGKTLLTMPSTNMRSLASPKGQTELTQQKVLANANTGRNTGPESGTKSPREIAEAARARLEKLQLSRGN